MTLQQVCEKAVYTPEEEPSQLAQLVTSVLLFEGLARHWEFDSPTAAPYVTSRHPHFDEWHLYYTLLATKLAPYVARAMAYRPDAALHQLQLITSSLPIREDNPALQFLRDAKQQ